MSVRNRKSRDFSSRHSLSSCIKRNLAQVVIITIITGVCTMSGGCHPAAFAASAFLLRYWEDQVQHEDAKKKWLAKQHEAKSFAQKPKINYGFFQQSEETLDHAIEAYKSLRWDKSTSLLKDALSKGKLTSSQENRACVLLGAISYQTGQINEAKKYFIKASRAKQRLLPSEELFPPSMIEFYREVRRR